MPNPFFIVFEATQNEDGEIYWLNRPVGVFQAPNAEEAIKVAAQKSGKISNFFACSGVPWGIAFMETRSDVTEFGSKEDKEIAAAIKRQRRMLELEGRGSAEGDNPLRLNPGE